MVCADYQFQTGLESTIIKMVKKNFGSKVQLSLRWGSSGLQESENSEQLGTKRRIESTKLQKTRAPNGEKRGCQIN